MTESESISEKMGRVLGILEQIQSEWRENREDRRRFETRVEDRLAQMDARMGILERHQQATDAQVLVVERKVDAVSTTVNAAQPKIDSLAESRSKLFAYGAAVAAILVIAWSTIGQPVVNALIDVIVHKRVP